MYSSYFSTPQLPARWLAALALLLAMLVPGRGWGQAATTIHLEAESALLYGPTLSTATAGYMGTGYVEDFSNGGDSIVFKFPAQASRYNLTIRYVAPGTTRLTTVQVNSAPAASKSLPVSATFASTSVGGYQLVAGQNKVVISANQGYYGIDYIELTPVVVTLVPLVNNRLEAELGDRAGATTVATTPTGFSGTGFVTGFTNSDADNVSINFNLSTAGLYQVTVGYTSPYGPKVANVTIDDSKSTVAFTGTTSGADFNSADGGKVLLSVGMHTIVIGGNYGYYGIDYVQLTPTMVSLPAKPPKQLTDPLATPTAKALHSYLVDLYGTKTLSGQQDDQYGNSGSEVKYVLATTGKEPAIVSMDLLNYASAAVAKYGPATDAERYLTWSPSGNGRGITALIWHWRAPADNVTSANPNGDPGGAFYTVNTAFNFKAALADTTSVNYHLLLHDMDLISVQLQKFQAAGIPVLWRPLHETPGTFFWWGNQGPDAFKQLWQLLYNRLTVHNHLHNLIWVYCANAMPDPTWYPGDAYVDVAGDDIYQSSATPDPNVNISGNWTAMQAMAPNKLIALTETESLVNPDQERGYATWWSWFCAWQGSYIRNQPVAFLKSLYTDADIITKDKLIDWTSAAPLAARSGAAATAAGLSVYPNPSQGSNLNVRLNMATAQEAGVELINPLGQRVLSLHTRLQAGDNQLQLPLVGVAAGIYQLVVRPAGQATLSQRVMVTN
ncbi:glycosyl hydrolase [Hymenobacter psoromatis]|uniref:glycosyl hydrolase n=1 Tax=Hymenobacter psoromatis TaxID=1484116 RepID=UPI001CBE44E1|nr:glycosyl hydrolase [Hymenobacter psoromatis]